MVKLGLDAPGALLARFDEQACLSALLEVSRDGLLILEAGDRITYCGAAAARQLGISAEQITGERIGRRESPASMLAPLLALNTPGPFSNITLHCPDGHLVTLTGHYAHLRAPSGESAALFILASAPVASEVAHGVHARVLDESNHRVRNNLATICALLEMEMLQAPEGERSRLLVCLARTRSLALPYNLPDVNSGCLGVAVLARAVFDSVPALFPRLEGAVEVRSLQEYHIHPRYASYLAVALTELAVHLVACAAIRQQPLQGVIAIDGNDDEMVLTIDGRCPCDACPTSAMAPLSQDILKGLVERSLGGRLELSPGPPFLATLWCPVPRVASRSGMQ